MTSQTKFLFDFSQLVRFFGDKACLFYSSNCLAHQLRTATRAVSSWFVSENILQTDDENKHLMLFMAIGYFPINFTQNIISYYITNVLYTQPTFCYVHSAVEI